jgi:hypothetical protein
MNDFEEHPLIAQRILKIVITLKGECNVKHHYELCPLKEECVEMIMGDDHKNYTSEWRLKRAQEELEKLNKCRYLETLDES